MFAIVHFRITNCNGLQGRAWSATYPRLDDAIGALMDAMGWSEMTLSESFTDTDSEGRETMAWCAYKTKAECDADQEGAHAPRIVKHYTTK